MSEQIKSLSTEDLNILNVETGPQRADDLHAASPEIIVRNAFTALREEYGISSTVQSRKDGNPTAWKQMVNNLFED